MMGSKLLASCLALVVAFIGWSAAAAASPGGLAITVPADTIEGVPTTGPLRLDAYGIFVGPMTVPDVAEIVVTDMQGQMIDGTILGVAVDDEGTCCTGLEVLWLPDEPLEAGASYDLTVRDASYAGDDELRWNEPDTTDFRVESAPASVLEDVIAVDMSLTLDERLRDRDCCTTTVDCPEGQTQCRKCWTTEVYRTPTVQLRPQPAGLVPDADFAYRVLTKYGESGWYSPVHPSYVTTESRFRGEDTGPYCVQLEGLDMSNGEIVRGSLTCVDAPEGTQVGPVELDVERPEWCEPPQSVPDAGHDTGNDAGPDTTSDASTDADLADVDLIDADVDADASPTRDAEVSADSDPAPRSSEDNPSTGCSHPIAPAPALPYWPAVLAVLGTVLGNRRH